jgi:hypothetical protein
MDSIKAVEPQSQPASHSNIKLQRCPEFSLAIIFLVVHSRYKLAGADHGNRKLFSSWRMKDIDSLLMNYGHSGSYL